MNSNSKKGFSDRGRARRWKLEELNLQSKHATLRWQI